MASFYKRGKTWTFSLYVGFDANGKRKKKGIGGFRTKKEAQEAAATLELEVLGGTYVEEKDITFSDFAKNIWLKHYSINAKDSSIRVRKHEMQKLNSYLEFVKMKDVSKKQYQDLLIDLHEKGYAENTIAGVHGTARMIFKKAVELGTKKTDPTQFARPPKKKQTIEDIEKKDEVPKFLEKDDLKTFLRFAHDAGMRGDYAMFMTLSYTGIRAGELCALKWTDIDFANKEIRITKTYYNPTNNIKKYSLQPPKTKASIRKIQISDQLIDTLTIHKTLQKKEKAKSTGAESIWNEGDFVFTVDKYPGYPIYIKVIENHMARLLRISGLPEELTPHSLRHTHTSLLAQAGVGLEEIMERLGHTDDDITRKVYLHITKDMKKEAAHKFDKLMNSL